MEVQDTTVKTIIVMATSILHNYLRVKDCNNFDNELEVARIDETYGFQFSATASV